MEKSSKEIGRGGTDGMHLRHAHVVRSMRPAPTHPTSYRKRVLPPRKDGGGPTSIPSLQTKIGTHADEERKEWDTSCLCRYGRILDGDRKRSATRIEQSPKRTANKQARSSAGMDPLCGGSGTDPNIRSRRGRSLLFPEIPLRHGLAFSSFHVDEVLKSHTYRSSQLIASSRRASPTPIGKTRRERIVKTFRHGSDMPEARCRAPARQTQRDAHPDRASRASTSPEEGVKDGVLGS